VDPATALVVVALVATLFVVWGSIRVAKGRFAYGDRSDLGAHVVVGVARPNTALPLVRVASAVARWPHGQVEPLSVHLPTLSSVERTHAEHTLDRCAAVVVEAGRACAPRLRIDESVGDGILRTMVEQDASLLVVGWPVGDTDPATRSIDHVLAQTPTPVVLARTEGYAWNRIVLRVPQEPLSPGLRASLRCATRVAERLATNLDLEVTALPRAAAVPPAADQLVVLPVSPTAAALAAELDAAPPSGDLLLALCHGTSKDEETSSSSARALYQPPGGSAWSPAVPGVAVHEA